MKKISMIILKASIFLIALIVLAAMIRFPQTEGRAQGLDLFAIYSDPFILYLYITSIPFFVGLYSAFRWITAFENGAIFSPVSLNAVRSIKYSAMALTCFLMAAISYVFVLGNTTNEDGTGAMVVGALVAIASSGVAAAASTVQKLLQKILE